MVSGLLPCPALSWGPVWREFVAAGLGPGHPSYSFRLPCTDCPPAIPTHILFNNLSLLNYLLAFPHHHPRLPLTFCLFPKAENGNSEKKKKKRQDVGIFVNKQPVHSCVVFPWGMGPGPKRELPVTLLNLPVTARAASHRHRVWVLPNSIS